MKPIFLYRQANKSGVALRAWLRGGMVVGAFLWLTYPPVVAQVTFEQTAPAKYRIEFTDKNNTPYSLNAPDEFLSQKALERRQKQGILLSFNDLPVTPAYIDSLTASGARVLTVSKWFNAATIQVVDDLALQKIATLTFVKKNYALKSTSGESPYEPEYQTGMQAIEATPDLNYGPSWWQTAIHNGHLLHNKGYTGRNITIAVIDGGFYHVNELPAFERLLENGQILGNRDFVNATADVYAENSHGMSVLSIIGGYIPGELVGTAPDASFWLLRSEDVSSEYKIEEDNWIAAAEFADSVGADIISTSLGYAKFDDPLQNHTYAEMDGNTTRVSRAADLAASKGMLVVVSAGNQGNVAWKYITAPADADSVLTIGAIDQTGLVAEFSSRGPSSDGRVKPDVMAIGVGTYVSGLAGTIIQGNGTSYSAPVISGLAACLWQTNPAATAMELLAAICESADRFAQPDNDYGFGIPDFNMAQILLQVNTEEETFTQQVVTFPNPFNNLLYIFFPTAVDVPVDITLYDLAGKKIFQTTYPQVTGRNYIKIEGSFEILPKGAYLIKISAGKIIQNSKLIKF
jgi:serine protease AprX